MSMPEAHHSKLTWTVYVGHRFTPVECKLPVITCTLTLMLYTKRINNHAFLYCRRYFLIDISSTIVCFHNVMRLLLFNFMEAIYS